MRYQLIAITVALFLVTGCNSAGTVTTSAELKYYLPVVTTAPVEENGFVAVSAIHESSMSGVTHSFVNRTLTLVLVDIPAEGKFLRLTPRVSCGITSASSLKRNDVLYFDMPVGAAREIVVVPLPGYSGGEVELSFVLDTAAREVCSPPNGTINIINDFAFEPEGKLHTRLHWTEVNTGDYNFDGLVNIIDITMVAQFWGQHYNRNSPQAKLSQIYWVDGDGDGIVGAADIAPIADHYNSEIYGYVVMRNGASVVNPETDTLPTIDRQQLVDVDQITFAPKYSLVLEGSTADEWSVVPIDSFGSLGIGSSEISLLDLQAHASVTGVSLLDSFDGSTASGLGNGIILRIIEPGDWPSAISIDQRLNLPDQGTRIIQDTNSVHFTDVPHQRNLLLDMFFTPAIDLATGEPGSDMVVTSVPFSLPIGVRTIALDVKLTAQRKLGGSYYLQVDVTQTEGYRSTTSRSRIDYELGTVSRINADNHSFENEAALADVDRDGISETRIAQTRDYDIVSPGWAPIITIEGYLLQYDEQAGTALLHTSNQILGSGESEIGDILAYFSELTLFSESYASGVQTDIPISPSELKLGDRLVLHAQRFDLVEGEQEKLWINSIVRRQMDK